MTEVIQLNYEDRRRRWSVHAILATILGVFSGPIMVGLVWLTGVAYGIAYVGSGIVAIIGLPVAYYCTWAYMMAQGQPRLRGRTLALIGLIATTLWSVGLIVLFCSIDARLE